MTKSESQLALEKYAKENPKLKMFSVYMNNNISHCYFSDTKGNISTETKIFSCHHNSIDTEITSFAEKVKLVFSIKKYLETKPT